MNNDTKIDWIRRDEFIDRTFRVWEQTNSDEGIPTITAFEKFILGDNCEIRETRVKRYIQWFPKNTRVCHSEFAEERRVYNERWWSAQRVRISPWCAASMPWMTTSTSRLLRTVFWHQRQGKTHGLVDNAVKGLHVPIRPQENEITCWCDSTPRFIIHKPRLKLTWGLPRTP